MLLKFCQNTGILEGSKVNKQGVDRMYKYSRGGDSSFLSMYCPDVFPDLHTVLKALWLLVKIVAIVC